MISFFVAVISSMLVIMGSLYSYRAMIQNRLQNTDPHAYKDSIEEMEDPHDLYSEEAIPQNEDVVEVLKEEKAHQKGNMIQNTTQNASAMVSKYRLIPYVFLILGFLALQKNHVFVPLSYMAGLAVGMVLGYFVAKKVFIS